MKRWMWLLAAALATTGTLALTSTVQADEKNEKETPVSLDSIPKPAHDALIREAGGAQIIEVVQETENGQTVYEAHVRKGTQVLGIEVDASGNVVKRETENNDKQKR